MAINNFTTIVSAIVDEFEDDSLEFRNFIPKAIDLAEQRLTREVDTVGIKSITTVRTSTGERFLDKPSGYRFSYNLSYLNGDGEIVKLDKKTDDYIRDYWNVPTSTSAPSYYSEYDEDTWLIAPTPDGNYNVEVSYHKRPTAITTASPTNYFTSVMPDALYYATAVEMCRFARMFDRIQKYEQNYSRSMTGVNNEGRRQRRDDEEQPSSPETSQNTLTGEL